MYNAAPQTILSRWSVSDLHRGIDVGAHAVDRNMAPGFVLGPPVQVVAGVSGLLESTSLGEHYFWDTGADGTSRTE